MNPQTATTMPVPDPAAEVHPQRRFRPNIYWYLTFRCNLSCAHCWVQSSPMVDTSADLTTDEALGVVDQMAELGVGGCTLTGGELLTRRDALQIIAALSDRGIQVAVETNALLIRQPFIDLVVRLQAAGRMAIGISLDGPTPEAHERLRGPRTFERTLKNLRRLQQAGVRFNLQCTLNRSNIESIPQLFDLAEGLRPALGCLGLCLLNPLGRGERLADDLGVGFGDLDQILTLVRENKGRFSGELVVKAPPAAIPPAHLAMALKDSLISLRVTCQFPLLGILPDGDITICALSRDRRELRFGNVRTDRLKEVWRSARLDHLRERYLASTDLQGICGDCIWRPSCRGGCRAWAYEDGLSFDAPYPLCAGLDAAGEFPEAYRLSRVGAGAAAAAAALPCTGCSAMAGFS